METLGIDAGMRPVYHALLEGGPKTPAALAARVGQDEADVRHALARLSALSLVRPHPRAPSRAAAWCVVDPELGLGALLAAQEARLSAHRREVQRSRTAVLSLLAARAARPAPGTARTRPEVTGLAGAQEVDLAVERLCRQATAEILCALPGPAAPHPALDAPAADAADPLPPPGVRVRALLPAAAPRAGRGRRPAPGGAELRHAATTPPVRMTIADRSAAVVHAPSDDGSPAAELVTSPALVTALYALFQREWAAARPAEAPPRRRETGLTDQEHALLELLREGLTDEMAARRLGVSPRTVRRTMSELLTRTGVRSRFQIGVVTGERGWLDGPPAARSHRPGPPPAPAHSA
ncbi:LuxR C-terminal-related transcriptional regulator [Streptomyces sp. TRM70308]|uniref:LuxR C-terminal-related transcriptional regulator n=1 Tax=Streptomyces sp. TRM70308 TaxID=3131932 RepID=UPI003D03BC22